MSISQPPGHRYQITNISFSGDVLGISYTEPDDPIGPVLDVGHFAGVNCVEGDMREQLWDVMEALCDIIDCAHQAQRDAERARR